MTAFELVTDLRALVSKMGFTNRDYAIVLSPTLETELLRGDYASLREPGYSYDLVLGIYMSKQLEGREYALVPESELRQFLGIEAEEGVLA